jgi:hypothetical protein
MGRASAPRERPSGSARCTRRARHRRPEPGDRALPASATRARSRRPPTGCTGLSADAHVASLGTETAAVPYCPSRDWTTSGLSQKIARPSSRAAIPCAASHPSGVDDRAGDGGDRDRRKRRRSTLINADATPTRAAQDCDASVTATLSSVPAAGRGHANHYNRGGMSGVDLIARSDVTEC